MISLGVIDYLENPTLEDIGHSPNEFLERLEKPTLIKVRGKDPTRTRALSTLLHGNEPSGFYALHRWLSEQSQPVTNMLCFLGGVHVAKAGPGFHYRHLPDAPDLNRCFREPFDTHEGQIAKAILDALHEEHPECLLDIHNTSGTGPSFAVTIQNDAAHQALASLFTERLIVTDLRLGALMEYSEKEVPTVTIECGGAQDDHAHALAYEGLMRYVTQQDVLSLQQADWGIEVLRNPVRIELKEDTSIAYGFEPSPRFDLMLTPDIEHLNFGIVTPDQRLGWVGDKGLAGLEAINHAGENIVEKILRVDNGELYPARPIRAFMITTNATIAQSDCLFYAVTDRGEPIA